VRPRILFEFAADRVRPTALVWVAPNCGGAAQGEGDVRERGEGDVVTLITLYEDRELGRSGSEKEVEVVEHQAPASGADLATHGRGQLLQTIEEVFPIAIFGKQVTPFDPRGHHVMKGTACIQSRSRRYRRLPSEIAHQVNNVSSRPGEFHPQPLTEPYVSLSTHTAPIKQSYPPSLAPSGRTDGAAASRFAQ
jgi:hypothetical protein